MIPVLIGTLLALVALAYVLYPLFSDELHLRQSLPSRIPTDRRSTALDALREIEFDHATGKLSEHDYQVLKASYTQRAVEAMRATSDEAATGDGDGVATAEVISSVVCGVCGPRPEADAVFCSQCGRQLTV